MRDYRQILFGPPELDSYIADNTKANLKELEFFRNTMTPEVAERAANISRAYPNMDKKLVMYGSMHYNLQVGKIMYKLKTIKKIFKK